MQRRDPIYKKVSDYSDTNPNNTNPNNNVSSSNFESNNITHNNSNTLTISIKNKQELLNYIQNYRIVVVDVWAKWCNPCKHFAPKFEELARKCSDVKDIIFLKDDIDNENSPHFNTVTAVPTFYIYTDNDNLPKKTFVGEYDKLEGLVLSIYDRLKSQN